MPPARSLVDTAPLRELLGRLLEAHDGRIDGVDEEPEAGLAACLRPDGVELHDRPVDHLGADARRLRHHDVGAAAAQERRRASSRVDHVMASSALPFFFPAIDVDGAWYGDGGIRLTAPLSPAVHLGATQIVAVSTRYARSREEADRPAIADYPPPAQVAGALYNAIFLDQLDGDALELQRINSLIARLPEDRRGRPAADRTAHAAAVGRSGPPRQRVRARAAARLPVSHPRSRHARDALERHAEPGHVPERTTSADSSSSARPTRWPGLTRFAGSSAGIRRQKNGVWRLRQSQRSACIGLVREARRAGMYTARVVTIRTVDATRTNAVISR